MKRFRGSVLITAALAAAALAGCGSTSGGAAPSSVTGATTAATATGGASQGSSGSAPASTTDLATAKSSLGQIIVDGRGMSVYVFDKDVANSGKSSCTGGCLTLWPPVIAKGSTPSVSGIAGKIGTLTTADGTKQLTVNGLPVYYYSKDTEAGDVYGQGVANLWWVLSPSGEKIAATSGTSGY